MDHMRISGTDPSSVILSQSMKFEKLKSDDPKVLKKLKQKGTLYSISNNFNTENLKNSI